MTVDPTLNFVTFNQDYSCLAVGKLLRSTPVVPGRRHTLSGTLLTRTLCGRASPGTSKGFRIFHTEPFSKIFSSDDGNIAMVEMLFSTSLVALILSPRHLIIQNTKVRGHPR